MRQFLFLLLVAGLVWWGYSRFTTGSEQVHAAVRTDGLDALVQKEDERPAATAGLPEPVATPQPLEAGQNGDEQGPLDKLAEGVRAGEAAAFDQAWRVLAFPSAPASSRQRVARMVLELEVKDAETAIRRLGPGNAFLHSTEGRSAGTQALGLCCSLADEPAVGAFTRLIELCMRGPIAKAETEAHAFVDQVWAEARKRVDRWLCNPTNVARARIHAVVKGDLLTKIAARFRSEGILVDDGSLAILNRIHNPNALQQGQRIKVPTDPIHTVIEKRSFLMAVYVGDAILRLYWVGHGADDKTPVTEFTVAEKLTNPDWYAPNGKLIPFGKPENILGKYFAKFAHPQYQGFGAHGTPQPETVGTMASMGCIRMLDADIEEFFRLVPRKSVVEVRDSK